MPNHHLYGNKYLRWKGYDLDPTTIPFSRPKRSFATMLHLRLTEIAIVFKCNLIAKGGKPNGQKNTRHSPIWIFRCWQVNFPYG
jgi:hypothetical protein